MPVRFNDRALFLGSTGSGKSEVINWLFAGLQCQRVLIDTKPEFEIAGVEPVHDVGEIDWKQRTIHYVTSPIADPAEFDELFRVLYGRRNLVTCVHELADVCDFQPNKTPKWFNAYLSKGRGRGLGLYMGSQRPVGVPVRARSENEHVFMIGERFMVPDDHKTVADAMGREARGLAQLIDNTQTELGGAPDPQGRTHAYLWFERGRRQVIACPPLPDAHRRAIDVGRTLEVDRAQQPGAGAEASS